jgi:hypothetical protein
MTGARRGALAGLGFALFLISFAGANPPGAISDEPDQYVKAIAAGHLDLTGTKVTVDQARAMDYWLPSVNAILTRVPAFAALARSYTIPSVLDPRYLGCTVEGTLATCLDRARPPATAPTETLVSSVGTYQPFIFVPAGLVMRLATTTTAALLLGRFTFTLLAALLLLGALLLAIRARPGPVSIVAIALAVAPTSVLVMSSISTSGAETAAGIAWWVALLAASEPRAPRAAWWLAIAAGLVLGVARTTGPVWLVLITLVVLIYRGRRAAWQAFRAGGRLALAAVATCVAATAVTFVWQLAVQPASLETTAATLGRASPSGIGVIIERAITTIGWGEVVAPQGLTDVWALMVAAVVALGVASALSRHARREIAALISLCVIAVLAIAAFLGLGSHAGLTQGRWFLALLAGVPILTGWMAATMPVSARLEQLIGRVVPVLMLGVVACLGAYWWLNEYHYAVNSGPLWFFGNSHWQPALGWAPWIVCAALGLVAVLVAGAWPGARPTRLSSAA